MDLNAQENGLCLEDPLEKLRKLFRSYWCCIAKKDLEKANEIWENQVPAELNSIGQSQLEVSRENLQTVLFEEKRRLQDHELLAEAIFEKMFSYLNQITKHSNEVAKVNVVEPYMEGSKTSNSGNSGRTSGSVRESNVPQDLSVSGLDLTAMIDSMLESEKLSN